MTGCSRLSRATADLMREDTELVSLAADGDRTAFSELMTRHQSGVHRFVLRFVRGEAATDVTQETFVSVWRNLARFDNSRPFGAWLRTIALNKCRDHLRRQTVRRLITLDAAHAPSEAQDDSQANPARITEARDMLAALNREIARLPLSLREPLILTALEGLSQTEAGAIIGISAKAVETRVYRARQKLAATLGVDVA